MRRPPAESEPYVRFSRALAEVAARQHGVVSLQQLEGLGLGARAVQRRAARHTLHRVHRGVYAIVPPPLLSVKGRYLAAVLACGPGAALSHRSAADLHGLRRSDRAGVDVVVPGAHGRQHPGLDCHCSVTLSAADITIVEGIPTTTVARTLLDLAAVVPRRAVERALDQAEVLNVLDMTALHAQIDRHPGAPLRIILAEHSVGATATWSELEELCLAVARRAGVPAPEVNAWVDPDDGEPPLRVDFVWRAAKVIVEADSRRYHSTSQAFELDRRRDQRLTLAGWRVLRVTYRQLRDEPRRIAATLRGLLRPA